VLLPATVTAAVPRLLLQASHKIHFFMLWGLHINTMQAATKMCLLPC
jgi:hypothetical protein